MHRLSITAIGRDRPGIVAAVTKVLFEHGCNLADCAMTMLGGQFAMIMLLDAPDGLAMDALAGALAPVESALDLSIDVHDAPRGSTPPPSRPYVISVYGGDHPGIVYRVTSELAQHRVNITDLMSRVVGEDVYTVVLDVDLPDGLDASSLERDLKTIAAGAGLDLSLREAEIDPL